MWPVNSHWQPDPKSNEAISDEMASGFLHRRHYGAFFIGFPRRFHVDALDCCRITGMLCALRDRSGNACPCKN